MQVLLVCAVGILNIVSFLVGERAGRRCKSRDGEENVVTKVLWEPLKEKRNRLFPGKAEKEARIQEDRRRKILENIEAYDGTDRGQQDVG